MTNGAECVRQVCKLDPAKGKWNDKAEWLETLSVLAEANYKLVYDKQNDMVAFSYDPSDDEE